MDNNSISREWPYLNLETSLPQKLVNSKPEHLPKLNINKNCKFILFRKSLRNGKSNNVWRFPFFLRQKEKAQKCNQPHEILYHKRWVEITERQQKNLFQLRWSSEWNGQINKRRKCVGKTKAKISLHKTWFGFRRNFMRVKEDWKGGGTNAIDGWVNEEKLKADFVMKI